MTQIQKMLFDLRDEKYREFHSRLVPTVPPDKIIGIRVPVLRKFAAEFAKTKEAEGFLKTLPHTYYEENNLHSFLIEKEKDFEKAVALTEKFLPYVDNWATCDSFSPKVFKRNKEKLLPYIFKWLESGETFTVRFGVEMLMNHFADEDFSPELAERVAKVKSDEYYVQMMCAWYFATLLAKHEQEILPYFTEKRLDDDVLKLAKKKARESFRISPELKQILK